MGLTREAVVDGESFEDLEAADVDLAGIDARSVGFVESRLERVALSEATLTALFLSDSSLTRCDLSNARVRAGSARRTTFIGCRLTGLAWTAGELRDCAFRDCRADLSSFEGSKFERVRFEDCDLRDADLHSARFTDVAFERCDLSGADLTHVRFEGDCVMRACTLEGLRGADRLRGVAMPWPDIVAAAGLFAAQLGVRLAPEREEAARKPPPL